MEVEGYGSAIVNGTTLPSAMTIKATMVDEFFSHQPYAVGSKATKTLAMKVLETPFLDPGPVAQWVSVKSFKPTIIKGKDKKGKDTETEDWSSAIQSAIDSGAKTIYFPKSQYTVYNTIEIRGSCQVLMGMDSSMKPQGFGNNPDKPVFKITTDEAVMVSRLSDSYGDAYHFFHHESKGDLILRNSITGGYKNFKEGGRVFLHDICGSKFEFKGQEVYARQLNTEADVKKEGAFNVHLQGGSLWCLGQKLEHKCPAIVAKQAKVEVLGLWTYHGGKGPLLTNDQGQMCVTGINMSTGTYGTVVSEESSNGKGEIQLKHNAPNQGSFRKYGAIMPLYFGH